MAWYKIEMLYDSGITEEWLRRAADMKIVSGDLCLFDDDDCLITAIKQGRWQFAEKQPAKFKP